MALIQFATLFGVGLERAALYGIDSSPMDEILQDIEDAFGAGVRGWIEQGVVRLIDELGPDLIAAPEYKLDHDPILGNGEDDDLCVEIPLGPYILDIGEPQDVGNGELARIILGFVDGDGDDSDVQQILAELITGRSGANLDFEFQPGIDGVELHDISMDMYEICIEDGSNVDTITFKGEGTEAAIASIATDANIRNFQDQLSFVELGPENIKAGGPFRNPIYDLVGKKIKSKADIQALYDAGLDEFDDRVDLIACDPDEDRLVVVIHNDRTHASDTLVLYGDRVGCVLDMYDTPDIGI